MILQTRKKQAGKYTMVFISLILALSIAGCGDNSNGNSENSGFGTDSNTGTDSSTAYIEGSNSSSDGLAFEEDLLVESSISYPASSEELIYNYDYTYMLGENGSVQEKYYVADISDQGHLSVFLGVYTYDSDGVAISIDEYGGNNTSRMEFEYDEDGNLVQETQYLYEPIDIYILSLYDYDEYGNHPKPELSEG